MLTSISRVFVALTIILSFSMTSLVSAGSYTPSRYGWAPTQLVISNTSSSTSIGVSWVDFDGNERYQRSIGPNSTYTQDTYLNHVWNIRDNNNGALLNTVTVYATYQQVSVTPSNSSSYSTYGSNRATKIYFMNSSNISIDLYYLTPSGFQGFQRTLRSGENYTQDTYLNHVWIIKDSANGRELTRTTSTNDYQTYTYSQNQPTYYNNYYPYNYNYNNYTPTRIYYGDNWNNNNGPVQYVYKKYTRDEWEDEEDRYYEEDYYEEDNYSKREACRLRDGTYDAGINMTISGRSAQFEVLGFKKSGSKITFRALETLTNGRTMTSRWSYNCRTDKATQL